ncbi:MAG: hypothetical protein HY721_13835, partial [Planctomycetes bacterium]|nr:hypothetical protein [Planctomycetota bacterium]
MSPKSPKSPMNPSRGVALIMVLLVLSALAIIGTPFVVSMALQDRASLGFAGNLAARQAALGARDHAIAHLEKTLYAREFEEEEEVLDGERPASRAYGDRSVGRQAPRRRGGMIIRRDLGEKGPTREERERGRRLGRDRARGLGGLQRDPREGSQLPEGLRKSEKGPSEREHDAPGETEARALGAVRLQDSASLAVGSTGPPPEFELRFDGSSGVIASASVEDEQGKINIDTAPPALIASLFGVTQLARPLSPKDNVVHIDDGSVFRGDQDAATIDGALVVVDLEKPEIVEAITYRRAGGDVLEDCFRGAFLSLIQDHVFPAGSFVYDLRGWKAGYHKLWARREGGFHPRELTRFASVEAIREIAGWQVASLFVARFRGEGLTAEYLQRCGVNLRKLQDLGLDAYLFAGGAAEDDAAMKKRYEEARKQLRKLGLKTDTVTKLKEARGARVVVDLAARLEGADVAQVAKVEADLAKSLASDRRRAPKIPERYLKAALEHLAEVYGVSGLETIEPGDLEWLRESVTVSSGVACEWSESQSVLDDVSTADLSPSARVARPMAFNAGTVVRIRSASDPSSVEYSEAAAAGGSAIGAGIRLAYPLLGSLRGYDATVAALERHPVNVNTASRRVLRAVLTGVRGFDKNQVVTPYEADQLAARILGARPLKGPEDLYKVLEEAWRSKVIDGEDVRPLLMNAIAPTYGLLRASTTGFCYASGDVYTIEARASVRAPSGSEVGAARIREIVEVSSARALTIGLQTQADMADGVFLNDPSLAPGFPESRHAYLLGFPGTRSHLVMSRPLLLHRAPLSFPAGDRSSLRLFPSETPRGDERFLLEGKDVEAFHFRDTYEGLELAQGEPFPVPVDLQQGAGPAGPGPIPAGPAGATAGAAQNLDLTMVPGGIEFWFRMRTYPDARSQDGHLIIFDGGTELERNRISLLYADKVGGRLLLRVYDASLRDPSVERSRENGQYLEVSAVRPLELETWYHVRATWDGVFGGGAQLFVDGLPAGTDNLSTELTSSIPERGNVAAVNVKDGSKLPKEGVVRIDQEL